MLRFFVFKHIFSTAASTVQLKFNLTLVYIIRQTLERGESTLEVQFNSQINEKWVPVCRALSADGKSGIQWIFNFLNKYKFALFFFTTGGNFSRRYS